MNITTRQRNGVTILDLKGKLTIGAGDETLCAAVLQAREDGATKIILNLNDVTTADSAGIGALVSSYTSATRRNAKLVMENLPPKIHDILTIVQLIHVLEVHDNEDEALASFT